MLRFKSFLTEAKKPSQAHTANVSNDDKGKLHELLLAKYLHPKTDLPLHHRSESENPEHAGTPKQVHDKLKAKIGDAAYNEVDGHAKQTAETIKKHLIKQGHLGGAGNHNVVDVHWTSNRDMPNKAGDHEKTTGHKDLNSNADLIITTHNKAGHKVFHGVSAKYGSEDQPNFKNAGLSSLEKMAGHKPGTYTEIQKTHEDNMEKLGYKGSKIQRHLQYKEHKKILDAEKLAHKESGSKKPFTPKSKEAKMAHAAELASQEARAQMARKHEQGLSKLKDEELRQHINQQVSPPTLHNHIVAHSHVQSSGQAKSIVHDAQHIADDHLNQYTNLKIKKGNGISAEIIGTHKDTGKERVIAQQTFKASSGPHKGTAGAFKLR